jgi:hypothetical protein
MGRRLKEERAHKDDPDIEVILLTASSREALVRTHARYFKTVPELAAALATALPGVGRIGKPRLSEPKVGSNRRKR